MELTILYFILTVTFVNTDHNIVFPSDDNSSHHFEEQFGECLTPSGKNGICVYVQDCNILKLFFAEFRLTKTTSKMLYLRQSLCGYFKKKILICCPSESTTPLIPVEENLLHKPTIIYKNENSLFPQPGICGTGTLERIYGGTKTGIDEFPWTALLEYTKPGNRKGYHCGGVLINKRYILTAAHCIKGKSIPSTWKLTGVRLGEWDLSSAHDCEMDFCSHPVQDIKIENGIVHEQYDPNSRNQYNDIALLRLLRSVQYTEWIKPICLPFANHLRNLNYDHLQLYISGWGKTEKGISSNVKLKAQVNAMPLDECHKKYKQYNILVRNTQICAGGVEGIDSCRGDSGGPLFAYKGPSINDEQSYYFLVGIVSFGLTSCGQKGWPGVYTKIEPYLIWIENNVTE